MTDIVVLYCNDKDENWKRQLDYYLGEEGSTDRQVIGEERYRDWECFKYWFRGVEKNCKWVNKVFLILASPSQVPKWLDITNTKLRIVYHEEFIPKILLPTFNASTIELFVNRIEDLSNNYVYCNDDFYFINPVGETNFFINEVPVYSGVSTPLIKYTGSLLEGTDATFYKMLNNCMDFQLKISKDKARSYEIEHLPSPHKKDFEQFIYSTWGDNIINAQIPSKFRHCTNLSQQVYLNLFRDLLEYVKDGEHHCNSKYVTLKSDVNFDDYSNCAMVCFNDTEQLDNYEVTKKKMIEFFEKKFPNKCSFER